MRPEFEPGVADAEAAKLKKFSEAGRSQIQWLSDAGRFTLWNRPQYNRAFALARSGQRGLALTAKSVRVNAKPRRRDAAKIFKSLMTNFLCGSATLRFCVDHPLCTYR
jgi:hypothetical protein